MRQGLCLFLHHFCTSINSVITNNCLEKWNSQYRYIYRYCIPALIDSYNTYQHLHLEKKNNENEDK